MTAVTVVAFLALIVLLVRVAWIGTRKRKLAGRSLAAAGICLVMLVVGAVVIAPPAKPGTKATAARAAAAVPVSRHSASPKATTPPSPRPATPSPSPRATTPAATPPPSPRPATPPPAPRTTAPPAPAAAGYVNAAAASAATTLSHLPTVSLAGGYARSDFPGNDLEGSSGYSLDGVTLDWRYDALRLDSSAMSIPAGKTESYATGTLDNEYLGTTFSYSHGSVSTDIQVDHVVSLGDAWETGASTWTTAKRAQFAVDLANLRAVDTHDNESKGDADASSWLPPDNHLWYAETQIAIKAKYGLGVTSAERAVLQRILTTGQ